MAAYTCAALVTLLMKLTGINEGRPAAVCAINRNLIKNSQAVKKRCGPQKGYGEKKM